jgi:hypothetical protein
MSAKDFLESLDLSSLKDYVIRPSVIRWDRTFENMDQESLLKLADTPCIPCPFEGCPPPEVIAFAKWRYCLSNRRIPHPRRCVSCKAYDELQKRLAEDSDA